MAGERILIVDDQESILDLLTMFCEAEGYEVAAAKSGAEARRLLREGAFDVGIVDLLLPDAHGLDVLREARAAYPDIEVIILTGHSDLQTAVDALRLGAYDYMQKPLADLQIIPLTIRRALDRQELARHNKRLLRELQEANDELDRRRRQHYQSIQHIGHALTGALLPAEVAQVLVEAMLSALSCDGAGCLVLPRRADEPPRAVISGPRPLTPGQKEGLLAELLASIPSARRPDANVIVLDRPLFAAHASPSAVAVAGPSSPSPSVKDPAAERERDDAGAGAGTAPAWLTVEMRLLEGRDGPLGAIGLASRDAQRFDEDTLAMLGILASQGSIAMQNAHLFARMRELATRDSLTGLLNHGHFFELLAAEISRAERYAQHVSVIMLDIDRTTGLKVINDTYGHQAGDRLLRQVADLLRSNVRQADIVARYGGDEFIILAPQAGQESGLALAERLRAIIADTPFLVDGREERISVSVGLGVFCPGIGQSVDSVVSMADRSCYLAKDRGGNQVAVQQPARGDPRPGCGSSGEALSAA